MLLGVLEFFYLELLLPLSMIEDSIPNPDIPISCTNTKQQFKELHCKAEIFVLFLYFLPFKNVEETIQRCYKRAIREEICFFGNTEYLRGGVLTHFS